MRGTRKKKQKGNDNGNFSERGGGEGKGSILLRDDIPEEKKKGGKRKRSDLQREEKRKIWICWKEKGTRRPSAKRKKKKKGAFRLEGKKRGEKWKGLSRGGERTVPFLCGEGGTLLFSSGESFPSSSSPGGSKRKVGVGFRGKRVVEEKGHEQLRCCWRKGERMTEEEEETTFFGGEGGSFASQSRETGGNGKDASRSD